MTTASLNLVLVLLGRNFSRSSDASARSTDVRGTRHAAAITAIAAFLALPGTWDTQAALPGSARASNVQAQGNQPSLVGRASMICGAGAPPVRPGVGIGPIQLGMSPAAGAQLLKATVVDTLSYFRDATRVFTFTYVVPAPTAPPEPNLLILSQDDRIVAIKLAWDRAFTERCVTASGIHLGSPQQTVRAVYGRPQSTLAAGLPMNTGIYRIEDYVYNADGIAFSFEPAAAIRSRWTPPAVTSLTVFPPGRFCDVLNAYPLLLHDALSCAMFEPRP